ncbi:DNA polymerase III subunit delta' [Entomohabitans teleogrylli]|uniref:DNA polymerase III subunit delta' n=1 Tax=Entomohabitans teleogrylli TaxID=1384589 RepID=UPI00073D6A60|nr:DNA polymerase III subunit delta' [Entomohabitans teleogrylli]
MRWYPWLRGDFERLMSLYQSGRGHHALLLHAQAGLGDDALIYALSRWLMCQQPDGNKSCGKCRGCQLMQAGTHPDYHVITPEKGKSTLGIDPVRQVTEALYGRARQGGARVVWIPDAGWLTEAAANALLKTLEEPPQACWFFLGTREPEKLLATLRSRCLYWYLAPPEESYALAWLAREAPGDRAQLQAALRLSMGAPAAALELLEPEQWQRRNALCNALGEALNQRDMLSLLAQLNDDRVLQRLQWLSSLLLDALKWQQGAAAWLMNGDMQPVVAQCAGQLSTTAIHAILHSLLCCRERLAEVAGVNRELLLTEFLLSWEHLMRPGAIVAGSQL